MDRRNDGRTWRDVQWLAMNTNANGWELIDGKGWLEVKEENGE